MRPVARNITVKPVVPMAVLERKERATEEKKELVDFAVFELYADQA